MIPEEGSVIDFKRAALQALPSIPRYHERHWLDDPIAKWYVIFNISVGILHFGVVLIELAYGVSTWLTWLRIPIGLAQFGFAWFIISSLRHGERNRTALFEEFRIQRDRVYEHGYWMLGDMMERRMANMIRRRSCSIFTDWQIQRRNKRHVDTRQCPCCKQIVGGLRSEEPGVFFTKTVYTFLEICPLCGWDWR